MVLKFNIPEELQHPGWEGEQTENNQTRGLKFAGFNTVNQWIVRLQWKNDGSRTHGTGFFVNIPGAAHDVILTAAHNLIDSTGQFSQGLVVHIPRLDPNHTDPNTAPKIVYVERSVPETDFRASAEYMREQTRTADWGAILLPYGTVLAYGFGFSIKLAYEQSLKGSVFVSGYRAGAPDGDPSTSSGICTCYDKQLEYKVQTEVGISGSPVWYEYGGKPTIVAIHNAAPPRPRAGSRGSRITLALLRELCGWVGVGRYGVQLRARAAPKHSGQLPRKGLFLKFSREWDFARVKLGSGSRLDVLPVVTVSGDDEVKYAMVFGTSWVSFNGVRKEVKLTDKLKDSCFFIEDKGKKEASVRIVVEGSDKELYQLRMQGTRIREFDGDDAESSEVSMVGYPHENRDLFTQFVFE